MDKFSHLIIEHKKLILAVFISAAILCAIIASQVSVNYNMVDYLPEDAQSTTAIEIMEKEFSGDMPNARVMLKGVTIHETLSYKKQLEETDGISSVTWLDDVLGLETLTTTPLEFLDEEITKNYYKDNVALMNITVESGKESPAIRKVYDLIGKENAVSGDAVNIAEAQAMSVSEVLNAIFILVPVILIILILSTTSWLEPLLFVSTIGVAVLINMGTNLIFKEVSFITLTVSPVLQLAVSMDYAIFLLHCFNDYRKVHDPKTAMQLAMKQSLPTIAASAATTVIGFAALIFMRFGIGADLGLNLLKGVILSFVSVMVFLPVLTLMSYRLLDKTRHRMLVPDFKPVSRLLLKVRMPFLLLALLVVIPSYLAQTNTEFVYGMGSATNIGRIERDTKAIEERFGRENTLVLLVQRTDAGVEAELCKELSNLPHITNIVSYVTAVGAEIPYEFIPVEAAEQFISEKYSRIILYTDTPEEGDDAFNTVQQVCDTAKKYFDTYYLAGQSATLYDMKEIVSKDTVIINLIAIIGIFIVLLITFRSLILPLLLLFTIETAIWVNLSIPYLTDKPLNFIGYLIISTVQLGATVDYAILLTNNYLRNRQTLSKMDAMRATTSGNLAAILVSGGILAISGFTLAYNSSNPIVSELGRLLGRGAALSFVMVVCVLPTLLLLFDSLIKLTTGKKRLVDSQ